LSTRFCTKIVLWGYSKETGAAMRNPFKRTREEDASEYFKEREKLAETFRSLAARASVTDRLERCEQLLEPDWLEDQNLPPSFTRARSKAERQRATGKLLIYKFQVRLAIFGVENIALRIELIACQRKLHALRLKSFQHDLYAARQQHTRARKFGRLNIFWSALGAAVFVLIGWGWGGPMWATAAAAFAIVVSIYSALDHSEAKREAVEEATAEILRVEESIEEMVENEVFDSFEESCGVDSVARERELGLRE